MHRTGRVAVVELWSVERGSGREVVAVVRGGVRRSRGDGTMAKARLGAAIVRVFRRAGGSSKGRAMTFVRARCRSRTVAKLAKDGGEAR